MLCNKACTGAVLFLALLISTPLPLSGQYIVGQGLVRETSAFSQAYPQKTTSDSSPDVAIKATASQVVAATPAATVAAEAAATPAATNKAIAVISNTLTNSTSSDTALYAVLRIIGTSVTPFNYARQTTLLNALGQVISYVDFSNISIMDVNSVYTTRRSRALLMASEEQLDARVTRRRSLLASALSNVADVSVEMVAGSNALAAQALAELNYSIANGTLATQLQSLGQSSWAVQMQSYNLTTPGSINATVKTDCHDKFGHWCLDKHKHLSSQGLKGVIAGGVIGIIAMLALLMLLRDLWGARRNRGNEVVYNPQTPNLAGGPGTGKAGAGGLTLNATAGGGTPGSGATPTSAGYTGGLAPVGTKVRRQSGAFTSGAVTHPASLAAAGKPTGLEGVVTPVGTPSTSNEARRGI